MAPFYPPAIYQKHADVRICSFKFLLDVSDPRSQSPLFIVAKSKSSDTAANEGKHTGTSDRILPCTPKNLAAQHIPIKSIAIPEGWIQTEGSNTYPSGSCFEFHPDGKEDVVLALYWDAYHVPGSLQHTLKDIMRQPLHNLTSKERYELFDLFPQNKASRNFSFTLLHTVIWNGRKVIETEGEWPNSEEYSHKAGTTEYCLIYDLFGNGESAAQIYFRAPKEEFSKYADKAKECMRSIKWTKKN